MDYKEFMNKYCPQELIGDYIFEKKDMVDGQIVVGGTSRSYYLVRIKDGQPEITRLDGSYGEWKPALGYELHEYLGRKNDLIHAQDL